MTLDTAVENHRPAEAAPRIWRASRADLDALRALKEHVVDTRWGREYPAADLDAWKARFTSRAYFTERLVPAPGSALTRFFATGASNAPDGMVALKVRDGRAYIGDLYVSAAGHGIGRHLLEHAEAEAGALGLEVAVADVFEGNREAYQLLVSDGFREEDEYVERSLGTRVLRLTRTLAPHHVRAI